MGVVQTAGDILELVQKYNDAELNQQILDLQSQVGELLQEKHEVEDRCRRLEHRVGELEEELTFSADLELDDNVYWQKNDGGEREGPFCPRCRDVEDLTVRLLRRESATFGPYWECPECETEAKIG